MEPLVSTTASPAKPPGCFRVIHTADWHLGKMLGEHSREEEHQKFLDFLLDQIEQLSVDALVIAGDIFDSGNPPQSAVARYFNFLSELHRQGGCSVVIVAGNHDSPAQLEAPRQVLKALGAHVVGTMQTTVTDLIVPLPSPALPKLVVAAVPFLRDRDLRTGELGQGMPEIRKALVQGITNRYQEVGEAAEIWQKKGAAILATGHLTVVGCSPSDSEREIHVGGLGAVGVDSFPAHFSYVALGHLHRPQCAGKNEVIRYSGSPIALSFSESADTKELRLLDFGSGKLVQQTRLEIPLSRQLIQIRCKRQDFENELKGFQPKVTTLTPWVEIVVDDPAPGENLYELAKSISKGKSYEVIRVTSNRSATYSGTGVEEPIDLEGIEKLLGDPAQVFEHRLTAETSFTVEEHAALKVAFNELTNLHQEQQREREVVDVQPDGGQA